MSATRLPVWLILLSLLLAPLAMIGASPAAAHSMPAAAAGHCAEDKEPVEVPPSAPVDCMIACAGCLPMHAGSLAARPQIDAADRSAPIPVLLRGLHLGAATPPPRS